MTSNYRRGVDAERALMRRAFEAGCLAIRAPGSHGADVIVFGPRGSGVWAVNVKRGGWAGPSERRDHYLYGEFGARPILARSDVIGGKGRGRLRQGWSFRLVTAEGGMEDLVGAPWE